MKKIYWGDIHNHNETGYGTGSMERSYAIARGAMLDFYAFTPHGHWPDAPRDDPRIKEYHERGYQKVLDAWPMVAAAAEKENHEGKFVALPAFEWHSSGSGDYCLYPPDGAGTFPAANIHDLKEFARQHGALMIPHHIAYPPGRRGLNWDEFDPQLSPAVEAFSEHGCSIEALSQWPMERHSMGGLEASQTVFEQLNKGRFFGIVGSTDNHYGHPASYGEGLTGLYTDDLSRSGVLTALKQRRSTVVTGDRIETFLSLGQAIMGDITEPDAKNELEYSVSGFCALEFVQIIKNGVPVHTTLPALAPETGESAFRIEFGWGAMMSEAITDWKVEVSIKGGKFLKISPGFTGGADSEKTNKITTFTQEQVNFEAFTSRKNTRPVSCVAFRCSGESPEITVNARSTHREKTNEITVKLRDLREKNHWLRQGKEFSAPVMKIGGYSSGPTLDLRETWRDPEMKSGDWYMLKAQQKNGDASWTSPIKVA